MNFIVDEVMREMEKHYRDGAWHAGKPMSEDELKSVLIITKTAVDLTMQVARQALLAGRMDLIVPETPPEERRVPPPQYVHGINCEKRAHVGDGHLHDEADDSPFNVDGVMYCGRCHMYLPGDEQK